MARQMRWDLDSGVREGHSEEMSSEMKSDDPVEERSLRSE